jgi:phage-related minor tail protein
VHLVGFTIEIYHDARPHEQQFTAVVKNTKDEVNSSLFESVEDEMHPNGLQLHIGQF